MDRRAAKDREREELQLSHMTDDYDPKIDRDINDSLTETGGAARNRLHNALEIPWNLSRFQDTRNYTMALNEGRVPNKSRFHTQNRQSVYRTLSSCPPFLTCKHVRTAVPRIVWTPALSLDLIHVIA